MQSVIRYLMYEFLLEVFKKNQLQYKKNAQDAQRHGLNTLLTYFLLYSWIFFLPHGPSLGRSPIEPINPLEGRQSFHTR